MARIVKNLINLQFGKLTVIEYSDQYSLINKSPYWVCKCECGKIVTIKGYDLTRGKSKSCGCSRKRSNTSNGIRVGSEISGLIIIRLNQEVSYETGITHYDCKLVSNNLLCTIDKLSIIDEKSEIRRFLRI